MMFEASGPSSSYSNLRGISDSDDSSQVEDLSSKGGGDSL